jgi:hypothetical protein
MFEYAPIVSFIIILPITICISIAFIASILGWIGVVCVVLMLIMTFIGINLSKFIVKYRMRIGKCGDDRTNLL